MIQRPSLSGRFFPTLDLGPFNPLLGHIGQVLAEPRSGVISPTKREAAKLLSIAIEWLRGDLDRRLLLGGRQLISTPNLLNRFGQVHPYSGKPEHLGAFLGVVHALR
jgi:hypothetical protein